MAKVRFSKANLINHLEAKAGKLIADHGFTRNTGWEQVRGETADVVTEYGKFEAYCDLIDEINGDTPWKDQ